MGSLSLAFEYYLQVFPLASLAPAPAGLQTYFKKWLAFTLLFITNRTIFAYFRLASRILFCVHYLVLISKMAIISFAFEH